MISASNKSTLSSIRVRSLKVLLILAPSFEVSRKIAFQTHYPSMQRSRGILLLYYVHIAQHT